MNRYKLSAYISTLLTILLFVMPVKADEGRDSLVVSLLTAWPGSEVYELCGHSAIRIRQADMPAEGYPTAKQGLDSVWNYGLFSFDRPNFVYRFVKGDTDYMVGGYPFAWFLPEYADAGRRVLEQELDLTQEEARRLRQLLQTESLPQNRVYRYNYVKDNCATRITDRLSRALGQRIHFPDTVAYGTFRKEMRAFHHDYPWYQFGIDLALGSGLDYPLRSREEMFVPVVMSERYAGATLPDGRKLVRATRELSPDSGHATLPPTPWYLTPLFWSAVIFLVLLLACMLMARKRKIFKAVYAVWFGITGIAGCIIAFLVFVSSHEATSPNLLILWLNPLQLLVALGVWWRRTRWLCTGMIYCDIIVTGVLLLLWPFQAQSANPAIFPCMGATFALCLTYAILNYKQSYTNIAGARGSGIKKDNRNAQVSNNRAHRAGGAKRDGDTSGKRGVASGGGHRR